MARSVTLFRGGALVVALALVALLASSTRVAAAPPSVGFSSSINLSNSGAKSVYPVIAYDAAGKLHVAWLEYDADPAQTSRVMYTNNVNGSFLAPYQVTAKGGKNATHILAIAVETNRVHLFYTTDTKALRHTLLTLNGATPSPGSDTTLTPGGARGYAPSAIVDSAGRVQAAWIDNRSGQYQVYHRIWSNGGWEGSDRIVRATGAYQNFPSLAATNDGRVHVIYENNNTESYAYFDGSWRSSTNPGGGSPNQQYLASDGTTLYAVWSVTTSTHIVNFAQGVNGAWSGTTQLSDGGRWSDYPSITYNATNNKLYAFWAAGADGGNTSIVMREITPGGGMSDITTIGSGPSTWPRSASGPSGVSAVWQDKASGAEDVRLTSAGPGVQPGPPPPPPPPPPPSPQPSVSPSPRPSPSPSPVPTPTPSASPAPTPNAPPTGSFDFANGDYRDLWTRTDSLVKQNAVSYSWIWGPAPFTGSVGEYYVQSPGQVRYVQYFDKSRMEINEPGAPRGPYYVSNGRLADELITGLLQTGDAQYEQRSPAVIALAGDPQNTFPYYRDLKAVYRRQRNADRANELIAPAPDGSLQIQPLPSANTDPSMVITQRVAGLGIPKIFWDFMNQSGKVVQNGQTVNASPLFDWRYVIGEPLTEAYWTYIKVGGRDQGVLVQAFERRVLTYTPANPSNFQVEMGNIGRHYFEWRYGVRPR